MKYLQTFLEEVTELDKEKGAPDYGQFTDGPAATWAFTQLLPQFSGLWAEMEELILSLAGPGRGPTTNSLGRAHTRRPHTAQ